MIRLPTKKKPVLRARPTHFFPIWQICFFNLPKFCKIGRFLTKILIFYLKNVENKSEYFLNKFLQKKSDFFRKFRIFKVIFAPEIKKKSPDRPTQLGRSVRP